MNNIGISTIIVGVVLLFIIVDDILRVLFNLLPNLYVINCLSYGNRNCGLCIYDNSNDVNNSGRHKSGNLFKIYKIK